MSVIYPITYENIPQMVDRIEKAMTEGHIVHIAQQVATDELWEINEGDIVIIESRGSKI